jgi:hypothetical protein
MVLPAALVCIMLANAVMGQSPDHLGVGRGLMLVTGSLCQRDQEKNVCVVDGRAYSLETGFKDIFDNAYVRAEACTAASYEGGCKKCALLEELVV